MRGLGFGVWGFRVIAGFRISGFRFLEFEVEGSWLRGLGCWGFGLKVEGFKVWRLGVEELSGFRVWGFWCFSV